MTSLHGDGLLGERVRGPPGANVDHLECSICKDLLWKPAACQTCETPFCSTCIATWLRDHPNKCPNLCEPFIERKCPPVIVRLLSQLQIACVYQPQGCNEVSRQT
jgi:hypothetical protein